MDLSTKKRRIDAMAAVGEDFITELRDMGLNLSPEAFAKVKVDCIVIGTGSIEDGMIFRSSFTLYLKEEFINSSEHLSVPSSGNVDTTNTPEFWKIVHAAEILQNWDMVVTAAQQYCQRFAELKLMIIEAQREGK